MISLALVATLLAGPIELECQMHRFVDAETPSDAPWTFRLTVNVDAGRVDWNDGQRAQQARAVITADEVRWANYSLSRIDLKLVRVTEMGRTLPTMIAHGRCRLAQPVDRAF